MITSFLYMNGYGIFVWSAFLFTFVCCFFLYLKTRKELKKQEKMFLNKFSKLLPSKIRIAKKQKVIKEILAKSLKLN